MSPPRNVRSLSVWASGCRLPRVGIHAQHAVFPCDMFLRRATEAIEPFPDSDAAEPDVLKHAKKLCLRQSAGDSTGPEVDVTPDRFRELARHDDIAIQELPAGLEHAKDFA